jgi:hypothetical protein
MTEQALTLDEFMVVIRPTIEDNIDAQIAAEPDPKGRALLRRYRSILVNKAIDATRIANLERRLVEAEARLKPRLVED